MTMPNEPECMIELRKIRAGLSEKMKNMSAGEWIESVERETSAFEREFGLNLPLWKKADEPIQTR